MNLNKLTERAQEAVVEAQREAETRQHTQVEPEHLLAAARLPRWLHEHSFGPIE